MRALQNNLSTGVLRNQTTWVGLCTPSTVTGIIAATEARWPETIQRIIGPNKVNRPMLQDGQTDRYLFRILFHLGVNHSLQAGGLFTMASSCV